MRKRLPTYSKGNLYYVRLKTPYGYFYKIGFTTHDSVHSRLNYGGRQDGDMVDAVLFFKYFDNAYQLEQRLHRCLEEKRIFSKYSNLPDFLLAGNGQSEVYIEDVLGIDPMFSDSQVSGTEVLLGVQRRKASGLTQDQWDRNKKINGWVETYLPGILKILLTPLIILLSFIRFLLGGQSLRETLAGMIDFYTGAEDKKKHLVLQQKRAQELAQIKAQIGC